MGGTQSSGTRKLSIPNEGDIIKVSESVVDRLTKCRELPLGPDKEEKKKGTCPPDENEIKVRTGQGDSPTVKEIGKSTSPFKRLLKNEKSILIQQKKSNIIWQD